MEHTFWHDKWSRKEIGFHLPEANPLLVKHFSALNLKQGGRVFLPLCGKTLDIAWLLANGMEVAGAELSELAVKELFNELDITPEVSEQGKLKHYSAEGLDIFVGDIFELDVTLLGKVDAIYDRAALVALPQSMRQQYTAHLVRITRNAPQLLLSFVYDQQLMQGPPFCITDEEVNRHYQDAYTLSLLETQAVDGGLKGVCPATEHVWLLN